jgi:hypothetical protein
VRQQIGKQMCRHLHKQIGRQVSKQADMQHWLESTGAEAYLQALLLGSSQHVNVPDGMQECCSFAVQQQVECTRRAPCSRMHTRDMLPVLM